MDSIEEVHCGRPFSFVCMLEVIAVVKAAES